MIPTDKFFERKSETVYEGKLYSRLHKLVDEAGKYILHFEFISTNSEYEQYIGLNFYEFKGTVLLNDEKVKLGRGKFPSLRFPEKTAPKCFDVKVILKSGVVSVFNGSDGQIVDVVNHTKHLTPAMIVEEIDANTCVFHCNDRVYDDFDDLVFSLRVEETNDD